MGVATLKMWTSSDGTQDIRLHRWAPDFCNPAIIRDSGAIHWHSFWMESRILEGRVRNTVYDAMLFADPSKPPAPPALPHTHCVWDYQDDIPVFAGFCRIQVRTVRVYSPGDVFCMQPGDFHFYEPLDGVAVTLVRRQHVPLPNYVLTQRDFEGPPVHGRAAFVANV